MITCAHLIGIICRYLIAVKVSKLRNVHQVGKNRFYKLIPYFKEDNMYIHTSPYDCFHYMNTNKRYQMIYTILVIEETTFQFTIK